MLLRWMMAAVHLLALGIGLGAVVTRGSALRGPLDRQGIARVLRADDLWALAAFLWISTGLVRLLGGLEKGTRYYMLNDVFWIKMGLLAAVFLLELWPIVTFIRWRGRLRRKEEVDTGRASTLAAISYLQAALVVAMVLAATAMARGIGS